MLLSVLFGCSDDETLINEDEVLIDINNPDVLTSSLNIEGATIVTGTPPASSTDFDAPVLDDARDLFTFRGSELIVPIDEERQSDVAGVYIQVKGASEYFDVPSSSLGVTGGRVSFGRKSKAFRKQEDIALYVGIPDNLSPGEFCVLYSVYDKESRVSYNK